MPASPTSGGPSWSYTPAPGVFGPGHDDLSITPAGRVDPYAFVVAMPRNQQWSSMQLYVFFNSYADVSWIVLNDGQFVTSGVPPGQQPWPAANRRDA